jgi:D-serine dehydratase
MAEDTEMIESRARWERFCPLLVELFPQLQDAGGRIDSPLIRIAEKVTSNLCTVPLNLAVKADHTLPLTGTVKARGGVYEVLLHAETLALKSGVIDPRSKYEILSSPACRALFSKRTISVGSTGNLGFSVGMIGRALGFNVVVHMSNDAKAWKKERLRDLGAVVVEHAGDYTKAVSAARIASRSDASVYFIDDENSLPLFWGYAAAAYDLKAQIEMLGIELSTDNPLDVFLPCGVGGAPGGITYGLKKLYGSAVRCIWVEPTASACMLTQIIAGTKSVCVYDIGLNNVTIADGLAVPSASMLVYRMSGHLIDAIVTVNDQGMREACRSAWESAQLRLEPAAASTIAALDLYYKSEISRKINFPRLTVIWTTGGGHLPDNEFGTLIGDLKM